MLLIALNITLYSLPNKIQEMKNLGSHFNLQEEDTNVEFIGY